MKHCLLYLAFATLFLCASCHRDKPAEEPQKTVGTSTQIEGDSTLYGLACDGCTDSVLIFLPGKGGDPVTYNIIAAMKRHKIIGKPKVGDWVAVILNGEDPKKADMVIDLDELKGTWVERVMPTLRHQMVQNGITKEEQAEHDSLIQSLMTPVEMGFALKRHYTAQPYGMRRSAQTTDEDSPVVYPAPKRYTEWHVINGQLVLTIGAPNLPGADSTKMVAVNDTADFILMTKDSLRLRFKDGEKGFYRK